MRRWGRFWKLSMVLILTIGPFVTVQLPWEGGSLFAAGLIRKTQRLPESSPVLYTFPTPFIHLPTGKELHIRAAAATGSQPQSASVEEVSKESVPAIVDSSGKPADSEPTAMPAETYVVGKAIQLLPIGPTEISLLNNGQIRFVATLTNERNTLWHITVTGTVELSDGSKVTVLRPHSLWMVPGQKLRLPVALTADPQRFPAGWTQFKALLSDDQGQIIDQASISFLLTLDLPSARP